jgi:lysozyme
MNRTALTRLLEQHEGREAKPYKDTAGHLTIGIGRNLDANPLSDDEIEYLFNNDVNRVWKECTAKLAAFGFGALDDVRQHVLMDLTFNVGITGVLQFSKMLAAVARRDFDEAAVQLMDSKAATQEPNRIKQLAKMMKTGAV